MPCTRKSRKVFVIDALWLWWFSVNSFQGGICAKQIGHAAAAEKLFHWYSLHIPLIWYCMEIILFFLQWPKTYPFCFGLKISEDDEDDLDHVFVGSKRKHSSQQPTNSRRHSVVQLPSWCDLQQPSSVTTDPQSSSIQRQSNTLKSAYRPANKPITTWTCNLALVACNFQRITAHFNVDGTGQVTTKELTKQEVIEVSPPSQSQSMGQAGFIGEGFTKRGIYVSRQKL